MSDSWTTISCLFCGILLVEIDSSPMFLCANSTTGTRSLLSLFYETPSLGAAHLEYSTYVQNGGPYSPTVFSNEDVKVRLSGYQIQNPGSFVPGRMEYRERSVRRGETNLRRLVLLRDDKLHYKVFKFAAAAGKDSDTQMS